MAQYKDSEIEYTIVLTGVTGSGKSTTANFLFNKHVFEVGDTWDPVTKHSAANVDLVAEKVIRIIDTPGFYDANNRGNNEKVWEEIARGITLAKNGFHAMGVVMKGTGRMTTTDADAVKELTQFTGLKDHTFLIFTHCGTLGNDDNAQLQKFSEKLSSPQCPQHVKDALKMVNNKYILVESVHCMSAGYQNRKSKEFITMIKTVFDITGKLYTNSLLNCALQLHQEAERKKKEENEKLYEKLQLAKDEKDRLIRERKKLNEQMGSLSQKNETLSTKVQNLQNAPPKTVTLYHNPDSQAEIERLRKLNDDQSVKIQEIQRDLQKNQNRDPEEETVSAICEAIETENKVEVKNEVMKNFWGRVISRMSKGAEEWGVYGASFPIPIVNVATAIGGWAFGATKGVLYDGCVTQ